MESQQTEKGSRNVLEDRKKPPPPPPTHWTVFSDGEQTATRGGGDRGEGAPRVDWMTPTIENMEDTLEKKGISDNIKHYVTTVKR